MPTNRRPSKHSRLRLHDSAAFALQPLERRLLMCTLEGLHIAEFHGPETTETEPNDSPETATPFGPTDTLAGSIASSGDVDYFVTSLTQGDRLRIRPGTDPGQRHYKPLLEVYDTEGNLLMRSGDGHEINLHATQNGEYYVRLSAPSDYGSFTGSYGTDGGSNVISVTITPFTGLSETEPNDTLAAANALGTTTNFRGDIGGGGIDVDAFSFTTTSTNTAVSFKFTGLTHLNPSLRLYDTANNLIATETNGSALSAVLPTVGTYRITVAGDNSGGTVFGGYVGTLLRSTGTVVSESEPGDNTFEGAVQLPIAAGVSRAVGKLRNAGDVDLYKFNLNAGRWYSFAIETDTPQMMRGGRQMMLFNELGQSIETSYTGSLSTNAATGFGFRVERTGRHYLGVRAIDGVGVGGYTLTAQQTSTFPTQRDVPLIFHDYTGQRTHLGYGPAAPLTTPQSIPAFIGMFEARYDLYDVDVTTTYPGAVSFVGFGAGDFGSIGAYGYGGSFNLGTRRASGDSVLDDTGSGFTSLSGVRSPASVMNQEIGHGAGLYAHARNPQAFMAYDSQSAMNVIGTYFPFPWTDSRVPDVESRNEREFQDWVMQSGRIAEELEPNDTLASPQALSGFLSEMTSDGTPRNDRVALSGRINVGGDVDVYSLTVAAGASFAIDIDSAELQHPLDATVRIFDASNQLVASSFDSLDRESGLNSVDPYLVHTFSNAGTYKIQVTGQNGTYGNYRLKLTSSAAFDLDGPRVIASWPNGAAGTDSTRQLMFWIDDKLDPATLTGSNIIVQGASSGVRSGSAVFDPTDSVLVWRADAPMPIDSYTVTFKSGASGIRDLRGNQLDGETDGVMSFPEISGDGTVGGDFVTAFTINANDTTPAGVSSTSVRRHPYNRVLFTVTYNDDLDVQSVYSSGLVLRGAGADSAYGTGDDYFVPIDLNYDKIKSTTSRVLEMYTRGVPDFGNYRLEGSLLDAAGNTVAVSRTFSFTAATSPMISGPSVANTSIQPGSAVVSPLNFIDVTFSAAVNPATLSASSFELRYSPDSTFFDGNDSLVADSDGTITWDAATLTARFQPSSALSDGYYMIELDGDAGGVAAPNGQLIDGEWLDSHIAGNTLFSHWQDAPSGDGFAGGDWRASFVVSIDTTAPAIEQSTFIYQTAPHRLLFNASENIGASFSPADILLENLTTSTTIPTASMALGFDTGTNIATLTFPGLSGGLLPDGNYRATLLAAGITDPAGNPLAADYIFNFFFLQGDANHDATVNLVDYNIVAANYGQSPRDFTQGDFNYDRQVNLADYNILAGKYGTILSAVGGRAFAAGKSTMERDDWLDELLA